MRVRFLGTSASPAMPLPFCTCDPCVTARQIGGKNLRRRSSLLINEDLLIDLGPDVASSSFAVGVSLAGVKYCLQTHPHADHFDPVLLTSRHPEWGTQVPGPLTLVGSEKTLERLDAMVQAQIGYGSLFDERVQRQLRVALLPVRPFEAARIGPYSVMPYPANHAHECDAVVYAISDGGHSVLYATDTAPLDQSVWRHMQSVGARYDLVILDHTYGIGFDSADHMAAEDVARTVGMLRGLGLLKEAGAVYATHLSHEGLLEHDAMEQWAAARGYRIAHDGLAVEL